MGSRNICTICQEVFLFQVEDKEEQPYALKCGHVFHNKCLSQWKANVNKCPQCRATAQNPIRLFFISDSDTNREELDVHFLQAELENERSKSLAMKKKYEETCNTLDAVKEKSKNVQQINDELKYLVPSLKDCVNNLRKENKIVNQTIVNMETELKENRLKLQSFTNIKDILDEKVDSIEIDKYKNMKPDMIANIVNQWKRNAHYYKQKEMSDRSKYNQLQDDLKKYKQDAVKCKEELIKAQQELKVLRSIVERKKTKTVSSHDLSSNDIFDSDEELDQLGSKSKGSNQMKRPNTSFVNVSPLVKKMKITNVLAINKKQPGLSSHLSNDAESSTQVKSSTVHSSHKPSVTKSTLMSSSLSSSDTSRLWKSQSASNCHLGKKPLSTNNLVNKNSLSKSTSLFKKTHSFKSSRDIINHFDK
uniref:E3 ubiquitin-protein ligase TRAIP n=1 Tax=Cacopsylla melanoneura TaxID=428564 RepID=A0A8D8QNZ4_9HEMI